MDSVDTRTHNTYYVKDGIVLCLPPDWFSRRQTVFTLVLKHGEKPHNDLRLLIAQWAEDYYNVESVDIDPFPQRTSASGVHYEGVIKGRPLATETEPKKKQTLRQRSVWLNERWCELFAVLEKSHDINDVSTEWLEELLWLRQQYETEKQHAVAEHF